MVLVEGGTFMMGATAEQGDDACDDEKPVHQVTLDSFYIGKYPVTQRLWTGVMGDSPSYFKGDNLPVECVSWIDVPNFLQKLNTLTRKEYRLPTEAEWEYAARGGNKSQGYKYAGSNNIDLVAWYRENCDDTIHDVELLLSNELGIYDMSGNVREWCQDTYDSYSKASQLNPKGPTIGWYRVYRGGSWNYDGRYCRVSFRCDNAPDNRNKNLGFRLAL